ncbi:GGDEF domain-containing protein [Rhodovulum sp. DZ06]|uniref:GGDEF domain-containing protein n=1 Tax=Rhodovulum sp. DZ06 TaxID=3425126 RepID=UPI003D32EC81
MIAQEQIGSPDEDPREEEFEAAHAAALAALEEAQRRKIPPDPRAFEVLYRFVTEPEDPVSKLVEGVFLESEEPALSSIERIYEEHMTLGRQPVRVLRLGERLDAELSDVAALVAERVKSDGQFIGKLSQARDGMGVLTRASTVKQVLREVIETSERYQARVAGFAKELETAHRKVEELSRELKSVRESAFLDHLTGVPNRRRLDAVLETEIAAAPENGPLCFALADLDHFKKLNDKFGHGVGDSVLKQFARILKQNVKGKDTPARYGGEEFALVLPATNLLGARHVTERIRQQLANRDFVITGSREPIGMVTASFGLTQLRKGETAAELVERADRLLYEAKEHGRNRVVSKE